MPWVSNQTSVGVCFQILGRCRGRKAGRWQKGQGGSTENVKLTVSTKNLIFSHELKTRGEFTSSSNPESINGFKLGPPAPEN